MKKMLMILGAGILSINAYALVGDVPASSTRDIELGAGVTTFCVTPVPNTQQQGKCILVCGDKTPIIYVDGQHSVISCKSSPTERSTPTGQSTPTS